MRNGTRPYRAVPSLARLTEAFGADAATRLRAVLTGARDPQEASEACAAWVRECYHTPRVREQIEKACDEIIGGYGTEAIWGASRETPLAVYVNTGDTYNTTLLFNYASDTVRVTTVGDFVEAYERRHGYGSIP